MTIPSVVSPALPWDAADPFPFYERCRGEGDVVWDETSSAWLVVGYAAAREVLSGPGWTSDPRANPNLREAVAVFGSDFVLHNMLITDGSDHRRLRDSVRDVFTPGFIAGLREGVDAIAVATIDTLPRKSLFDFMGEIALPLPLAVAGEWLGLDEATSGLLRLESPAITRMLGTFADADAINGGAEAFASLLTAFLPLAADRRVHPGDDLVSFIAADPDLCLEDVVVTAILIAVAGHETTANLLGAGLVRLLDEGDADGLRAADRIDHADSLVVSELLRLDAPVQAAARTATHDHRIGGVRMRRGQQALVVLAAANRDPAVFEKPSRFRLDRKGPPSLTFGHGVHYCLGAALARMEFSVALQHILARQPTLAGHVTWRDTPAIRGPVSVPMVFG